MISPPDDEGHLRARASRRQPWLFIGITFLVGVAGIAGARFELYGPPPVKQHGHHSIAIDVGVIVGYVALVVAGAAVVLWLVRAGRRDHGLFSAPLAMGLPRSRRRAVNRALRRGTPSSDPLQRAVEIDAAQRLCHGPQRRGGWVLPLLGLFEVALAVPKLLHGPEGLGILLCVSAFFMFWAGAYQLVVLTPGARCLLAVVEPTASTG